MDSDRNHQWCREKGWSLKMNTDDGFTKKRLSRYWSVSDRRLYIVHTYLGSQDVPCHCQNRTASLWSVGDANNVDCAPFSDLPSHYLLPILPRVLGFWWIDGTSMRFAIVFVMLWKLHLACLTLKKVIQMATGRKAVLYMRQENMELRPPCIIQVPEQIPRLKAEVDL